jgi:hypothetical protein
VFYNGAYKSNRWVAAGTAMVDSNGNVYGYPTYSNGEVMNPVAETIGLEVILILTGCYQQYMRNLH